MHTNILDQASEFIFNLFKEKLSDNHIYHDYNHTKETVKACKEFCKFYDLKNEKEEQILLAAWFHDAGYAYSYLNHEEKGIEIARKFLTEHNYPEEGQKHVAELIIATKREHKPTNLVEEIIHDADVIHVGKKTFFSKAELLRIEWESVIKKTYTDEEWEQLQLDFLQTTRFYTEYGIKEYSAGRTKNIEQQKKLALKVTQLKEKETNPGRSVETMYRAVYRTHVELSGIADNKANMMISINTIIMSVIITVVGSGLTFTGTSAYEHIRFIVPICTLLLTCLGSVIFAVISASPNVTKAKKKETVVENPRKSILFFGNFTEVELPAFEEAMEKLRTNKDMLYESMNLDIYFLGHVLKRKYLLLKISYLTFMIGLSVSVITFLVVFLAAYKA